MFAWAVVLFGLGILAFLDACFNYGQLFRTANSFMFMLVSLGVLIRTRMMKQLGYKERLVEHNNELKARVMDLKQSQEIETKKDTTAKVSI
jgi:hypothetical protein